MAFANHRASAHFCEKERLARFGTLDTMMLGVGRIRGWGNPHLRAPNNHITNVA